MSPSPIFLDLDGTLLDVSSRYQHLHRNLVRRAGGRPLDPGDYWQARREGAPETALFERAGLSPAAAAEAMAERQRRIEGRRYLRLDQPWSWAPDALAALGRLAPLVLVTLRRHPDRLRWQLDALGWTGIFERIVAGAGDGTPEAKARLLREAGFAGGSALVGDTEVDIASGRALGLRTIAVSSGIRSRARLEPWKPDLLLDDLSQVAEHLTGTR